MDYYKKRDNKVLVNTSIHLRANLSKEEFLKRVSKIENLKTRAQDISLFIRDEEDDANLTDLWRLINEGDFRFRSFSNRVQFVMVLENKYFNWFKNSKLELIKRQICNWLSATCLANPDYKDDILSSLYEPYRNEVEYIIDNIYPSGFAVYSLNTDSSVIKDYEQYRQLISDRNSQYSIASLKYLNSPPPLELENPFEIKAAGRIIHNLDSNKIPIQGSYLSDLDWLTIIERDIEKLKVHYGFDSKKCQYTINDLESMLTYAASDNLARVESQEEPWRIWLDMFQDSKNSKEILFDPIGTDLIGGFVYLIKENDSNYYKIGYTQMESGVPARKSGNQTGNPRLLIVKGYFPVSSKATESALHEFFSSVRSEGEWFELSEQQAENILDQQWRLENHFF